MTDILTFTGELPTRSPETAPFWDAANQGVLLLQKCNDCQKFQYHYRAHCSHCFSVDIADYPSAGEGTVWTFSTVYKNSTPHFTDQTPYAVGVAQMEGGVLVFGSIHGIDPEAVEIGLPVNVAFAKAEDGQMIPVFVAEPQ